MITEHRKMIERHLKVSEGYALSEDLDKFIEECETLMQNGCQRNNFTRDSMIAMLALLKALGKDKWLEPIKKKAKVSETVETPDEDVAEEPVKAKGKK